MSERHEQPGPRARGSEHAAAGGSACPQPCACSGCEPEAGAAFTGAYDSIVEDIARKAGATLKGRASLRIAYEVVCEVSAEDLRAALDRSAAILGIAGPSEGDIG